MKYILLYVCVFFTLNRSSTRRHPAHPVSVLILHPRKISSVVTSYDTEIMHRNAFDNAMSISYWYGYKYIYPNRTMAEYQSSDSRVGTLSPCGRERYFALFR